LEIHNASIDKKDLIIMQKIEEMLHKKVLLKLLNSCLKTAQLIKKKTPRQAPKTHIFT